MMMKLGGCVGFESERIFAYKFVTKSDLITIPDLLLYGPLFLSWSVNSKTRGPPGHMYTTPQTSHTKWYHYVF